MEIKYDIVEYKYVLFQNRILLKFILELLLLQGVIKYNK